MIGAALTCRLPSASAGWTSPPPHLEDANPDPPSSFSAAASPHGDDYAALAKQVGTPSPLVPLWF